MTPETIDFEFAVGIAAGLFAIIGILIVALSHVYAQLIRKDIKVLSEDIQEVKTGNDTLHKRITDHVEDFHTTKAQI